METAHQRPRVLLAETDAISARVLRHRLERDGIEVQEVADGLGAVSILCQGLTQAALLDVRLGGLTGFEVLEAIRAGEVGDSALPVVLLCWPGNDSVTVRAFAMHANEVIERPFSLTEASARIRRLLPPLRRS